MLSRTKFQVSIDVINRLAHSYLGAEKKISISKPTGDFFYNSWTLKEEFSSPDWQIIWNSLPINKGEARIIVMDSPSCYTKHADIDDRYHLNLFGDEDYLIDFDNKNLYKIVKDGIWYEMDAGKLHTAISVGRYQRAQLVVRKLLIKNKLKSPRKVFLKGYGEYSRYEFDINLSPWLNKANKQGIISNFKVDDGIIMFDVEDYCIKSLLDIIPINFEIKYEKTY